MKATLSSSALVVILLAELCPPSKAAPRFIYLTQCAEERDTSDILPPDAQDTGDVVILQLVYGKVGGKVQFNGRKETFFLDISTTWNEGRNALLHRARREYPSQVMQYYIFMDCDVRLHLVGGPWREDDRHPTHPYRLFERYLTVWEPAVGVAHFDWQPYDASLEVQTIPGNFDAIFNAFHAEAARHLLPYVTEFDQRSWHYSQFIVHTLASALYPHNRLQFNALRAVQKAGHAGYPRENYWEVPLLWLLPLFKRRQELARLRFANINLEHVYDQETSVYIRDVHPYLAVVRRAPRYVPPPPTHTQAGNICDHCSNSSSRDRHNRLKKEATSAPADGAQGATVKDDGLTGQGVTSGSISCDDWSCGRKTIGHTQAMLLPGEAQKRNGATYEPAADALDPCHPLRKAQGFCGHEQERAPCAVSGKKQTGGNAAIRKARNYFCRHTEACGKCLDHASGDARDETCGCWQDLGVLRLEGAEHEVHVQLSNAGMCMLDGMPLLPHEHYALASMLRAGAVMQDYASLVMRVHFEITDLTLNQFPTEEGAPHEAQTDTVEQDVERYSLKLKLELCAAQGHAACWADLGVLAIKSGDWQLAVRLLTTSLRCMHADKQAGAPSTKSSGSDRNLEGSVRMNLGTALAYIGDLVPALLQVCVHCLSAFTSASTSAFLAMSFPCPPKSAQETYCFLPGLHTYIHTYIHALFGPCCTNNRSFLHAVTKNDCFHDAV